MVPKQYGYRPFTGRICVAKLEGDGLNFVGGTNGEGKDDLVFEANLTSGDYFAFTEVDFGANAPAQHYVLASYSPANLSFEKGFFAEFLEKAISSCARRNPERTTFDRDGHPDVFFCVNLSDSNTGYGYVYYENNSTTSTLNETVTFPTFEGLELQAPHSGAQAQVTVGPGESQIVLLKKTAGACRLSMSRSYHFTES
jgi:hypothetical protein